MYSAFRDKRPSPLAELAIQYADFAVWQRNWLSGERRARQLDYWRSRLSGSPESLQLPIDRPRRPQQSYQGSSVEFTIEEDTTTALKQLSRRSGSTLFMTLLSAWSTLLGRYSGEEDIIIGSPVANRTQSAIEPLIGFFVNTLALRADLRGNPTFTELLARIRHTCLEAYHHQELPFEALVEALDIPRNLSHSPLFQVMFVLQNNPEETLALPELDITLKEVETGIAKFDLTLNVAESNGTLSASLEYASDLFDRATIKRMSGHFTELLHSVTANPDQPVHQLNILPAEERQQLLMDWNDTATPLPETTVHQMFEAQVEKTPDAIAVLFEEQQRPRRKKTVLRFLHRALHSGYSVTPFNGRHLNIRARSSLCSI